MKVWAPILAMTLALTLQTGTSAQTSSERHINKQATLVALVRSDRDKRSWKTLKLLPGKETRFYYKWILEDGSEVIKVENFKLKGVPDERPLSQRRPDVDLGLKGVSFAAGPITAAVVSAKKL